MARPLFEDVQFGRVKSMRISNITRGTDIGLQRDSAGIWYMVDPVAYRANDGLIGLLRQAIEGNLALRPPDPNLSRWVVGLDPPRAELVLTEMISGVAVTHRLLVGDPDATENRVYVLREGRLALTSRNLSSTLDKEFTEFRSRRISELDPAKILEVHRTGRVQHSAGDEPYDLELSAWREGAIWRSLRPIVAALDPMDVSLVSVGAGRLSFDVYVEEPEPDLGAYGLDPPEMRLEIKGSGGASEVLFFGRPEVGAGWFCRREGANDLYRLNMRDAVLLTYPFEAMIDRRLLRVSAAAVSSIRLERPGAVVRLSREGDGWVVGEGGDPPIPAEALTVRSLLAWVSAVELAPFKAEAAAPDGLVFDRGLVLEVGDHEYGGRVGSLVPSAEEDSVWFRRFGDEVTGQIHQDVLDWIDRPVGSWWSLSLLHVDELDVIGLVLTHNGGEVRFSRGARGRWRDIHGKEASALLPWLDPLLFLRAKDRVTGEDSVKLEGSVEVRFELQSGEQREFVIGRGKAGRSECFIGPVRAVLLRGDLHDGLLSLFPK